MPLSPCQHDYKIVGTLQGRYDFFKLYIADGDISNDPIVGHIRARIHISKLSRGGTSLQRQTEWWLGFATWPRPSLVPYYTKKPQRMSWN